MLERYKVWTHNIVNLVFFIFEQEWSFRRRDEKSSLQSTEKNVVIDTVQTALFVGDVDQTALIYLVDSQQPSTSIFNALFITPQLDCRKQSLIRKVSVIALRPALQ